MHKQVLLFSQHFYTTLKATIQALFMEETLLGEIWENLSNIKDYKTVEGNKIFFLQ